MFSLNDFTARPSRKEGNNFIIIIFHDDTNRIKSLWCLILSTYYTYYTYGCNMAIFPPRKYYDILKTFNEIVPATDLLQLFDRILYNGSRAFKHFVIHFYLMSFTIVTTGAKRMLDCDSVTMSTQK